MITGFLVFKDGEFKGTESFTEKYPGHFEVLADVHRRHGFEVKPIYSECRQTITELKEKIENEITYRESTF